LAIPIVAKITATLASDKRIRTAISSIIIGMLAIMLVPILVITSISNTNADYTRMIAKIAFDGGPITDRVKEEHVQPLEEMIEAFEYLDLAIEKIEEQQEEDLDDTKVKSFFYVLYFSKDIAEMDEAFYEGFIDCFVGTEDDNELCKSLESYLDEVITEIQREEIRSLYLFIKYGFTSTNNITGIPGEAFDDEVFAQLMSEATKYIGRPYVWGGSNPTTGFDCSGFVCWSYTQSGVYNLPLTTAQEIYNQCAPVSKDELKPGDLVFFHSTYVTSSAVTHLGIYVGDGQMIHCGTPIGYASLSSSYWVKHFYGYGRLQ